VAAMSPFYFGTVGEVTIIMQKVFK